MPLEEEAITSSKELGVNTAGQTNDSTANDSTETLGIASSSDNPILTASSKKVLILKLINQQWYIVDEESNKKTLIAQPEKQELTNLLMVKLLAFILKITTMKNKNLILIIIKNYN